MSRCFPFPPPGYERKARTDSVDLLKKEKEREKKHKKEKKDKEKREGKEKKEKDRSNGKHRDKKDKKEKHREKKDRYKNVDKSSASDEKRLPVQSEHNNGDKTSNEKELHDKPESTSGEAFTQKGKEKDIIRKSASGEKKFAVQFSGLNGQKLSQNSHLLGHSKDSKIIQELDRRTEHEERGTGNQLVGKSTGSDTKNDGEVLRLVAKAAGKLAESKEKIDKVNNGRLGGQGIGVEVKLNQNVMAENLSVTDANRVEGMLGSAVKTTSTWTANKEKNNKIDDRLLGGQDDVRLKGHILADGLSGTLQARDDGMPRPPGIDIEKKVEGKEKTKQKEGDDKRGDKHKHKEKEKKGKRKDEDRNKDMKKEEKSKGKNEIKNTEPERLKESNNEDIVGTSNVRPFHLPKESSGIAVIEGNLRKRKDSDTNGYLSANGIKPSKLPRLDSSLPVTQNGRTSETCQTSMSSIPGVQEAVNNVKVNCKEYKINGLIEAPPVSSSSKPLLTSQVDQIANLSRKPHPDSKYLKEILTVRKMEELLDFDDQEWLFHNDLQSKKPKLESYRVDKTPQVWSEALWIESADVYALPYVVPY